MGDYSIPWVEKYRPLLLDDIMYQDEVKCMLKNTINTGNLQHLLFYGPPGTGKTSTILALARELFGPSNFKDRAIELNASDERGINIVRNKIGRLAKTKNSNADKDYPSPPFKIIILDEADAMTTEAQSALRKTMETYSSITRFCFICNYINNIIEPITSRCIKFRFKPLNKISMMKKLMAISKSEKIKINNDCLENIIDISDGDMRKAITLLQNSIYTYIQNKKITKDDILEIANILPKEYIEEIEETCILNKADNIKDIIELSQKIIRSGYPILNIVKVINTKIIKTTNLKDSHKARICMLMSSCEKNLIEGADEYIQLLYILSSIKNIILGNNINLEIGII